MIVLNKVSHTESEQGFTLIETALMVLILSLIVVPLFRFVSAERSRYENIDDTARLERITSALSTYVRQNGEYPCPAEPARSRLHANYGKELCTTVGGNVLNAGVRKGMLPVVDLKLPAYMALNKHGWRYMYAVTDAVTPDDTASVVGNISVRDKDGIPIVQDSSGVAKFSKFVIIDPGADGKGSYNSSGTANTFNCPAADPGPDADDVDNCDEDELFTDKAIQMQADPTNTNYFDDTLVYTFANEESTMWQVTVSDNTDEAIDVIPRVNAPIGVGTDDPQELFEVGSGSSNADIRIRSGNLEVEKDVMADDIVEAGTVDADNAVISPVFYYE